MRQLHPEQTFTWKRLWASAFVAFPAQGWLSCEYFTHTAAAGVAEIDKTWQFNTAYTKQRDRPLNFSLAATRILIPSLTQSCALAFRLAPTIASGLGEVKYSRDAGWEARSRDRFENYPYLRHKAERAPKSKCISWDSGVVMMTQKPSLQKLVNSSPFAVVSGIVSAEQSNYAAQNQTEMIIISRSISKNKESLWGEFRH